MLTLDTLKTDEQIVLKLRQLFARWGYKKYKMDKFEEYDFYVNNRNFLTTENIITFTDMNGKLLALKPDITLSIVKNAQVTRENNQKLYYIENVYRLSRQNNEYREICQMGLEFLGDVDLFSTVEVIHLALAGLSEISEQFILDISHMGFISALFDGLEVPEDKRPKLLRSIRAKNRHELKQQAERLGLTGSKQEKLLQIPSLYGPFTPTLRKAEKLVINRTMDEALYELEALYEGLSFTDYSENIQLDFSMINDIDYYSSFIFQGYVKGIPQAILAGGRYDNLMKKFGKDAGAIGFALHLNELERYFKSRDTHDFDAVVLYGSDVNLGKLSREVQGLVDRGISVRVEKRIPEELRFKKVYRFQNGKLEEVPYDA